MFRKYKTTKQIAAIFLMAILAITGISAIFIDYETKEAGFTVILGNVEIELTGDDNLYSASSVTALDEFEFTRAIHNTGTSSAYAFATVTMPIDDIYLTTYDGTPSTSKLTQIFSFGTSEGPGVNDDWTLVTAGKYGNKSITALNGSVREATETHGVLDTTNNTVTYVYAYTGDNDGVLEVLTEDRQTDNLFELVKCVDFSSIERGCVTPDNIKDVVVRGYAVQLSSVADMPTDLSTMWSIFGNTIK